MNLHISPLKPGSAHEEVSIGVNLIGGHGGMSGQINQFNEIAEEFSFILNLSESN